MPRGLAERQQRTDAAPTPVEETDKKRRDVPFRGMHEHPFGNALDPPRTRRLTDALRGTGRFAHRPATLCAIARTRFAERAGPLLLRARAPPYGGFALSGILIRRHVYHVPDDG